MPLNQLKIWRYFPYINNIVYNTYRKGMGERLVTRKDEYIIAIAIILMYSLIGHLFNIDILKIMTIGKDEFSISIIGVVICIITMNLLLFIVRKFKSTGAATRK